MLASVHPAIVFDYPAMDTTHTDIEQVKGAWTVMPGAPMPSEHDHACTSAVAMVCP